MSNRLPLPRSAFLHKARDSMFPSAARSSESARPDPNNIGPNPFLVDCLRALESCNESLYNTQYALADGIHDMPRLGKVLSNELLYQVVTESTVRSYKSDVADEMEVEIYELMNRARSGLKQLKKEESELKIKVESNSSRPSQASGTSTGTKLEQRRLQMLVKQKDRVGTELAALEAEVDALELAAMGN